MAKTSKEKATEIQLLAAKIKQLKKERQDQKPQEVQLLGARIRELRLKNGYTSQETFANDKGYAISYYSRLERGEDIRFTSLVKVCEALSVSLEEFFVGMDIPKISKKKKK